VGRDREAPGSGFDLMARRADHATPLRQPQGPDLAIARSRRAGSIDRLGLACCRSLGDS
jgi:hypothetical protein